MTQINIFKASNNYNNIEIVIRIIITYCIVSSIMYTINGILMRNPIYNLYISLPINTPLIMILVMLQGIYINPYIICLILMIDLIIVGTGNRKLLDILLKVDSIERGRILDEIRGTKNKVPKANI